MAKKKRKTRSRSRRKTGKSINLGNGFRLNISSSGVNLTGGITGARMSVGTGGLKTNFSLPGTGIRKSKTLISRKDILDKFSGKKDQEVKANHDGLLNKRGKNNRQAKRAEFEREMIKSKAPTSEVDQASGLRESSKKIASFAEQQVMNSPKPDIHLVKQSYGFLPGIVIFIIGMIALLLNPILAIVIMLLGLSFAMWRFSNKKGLSTRLFNTGIKLYEEGKKKEGLAKMEEAIAVEASSKYMIEKVADINFYETSNFPGARGHYETLVKDFKSKKAILGLGKSLIMTGDSKEAISYLEPLLDDYRFKEDLLMEVRYFLGQAYVDELAFDKGKALLELVAKEDSDYMSVQRLLSRLG